MRKSVLSLILFLTTNFLYSQNSLTVNILHCKNLENNTVFGFNEIVLYKNDTIYRSEDSNSEIKYFENLPEGKYHIMYKTYFGDKKSETFVLKKNKSEHLINLCIDEIDSKVKNRTNSLFFKRIKNNEEITINCKYSGCFDSSSHLIKISKKKNKFYLSYNEVSRKLSRSEILSLVNYELELRNVKEVDYVSTGNTSDEIKYNNEVYEFRINSFWQGFQNLKNELKLNNL